ncbi:MAG: glycosyltransferase family 2 protein [Methylohalobius sp.]|nr:glycosyltransferase family 2 protein [Methylohalobius sp.]
MLPFLSESVVPITVVVVNWNGGALLLRTLAALATQSVAPEQVVVVDNASSDGSPDQVAQRFSWVKLRRLSQNLGFAAANNLALREEVQTPWVMLLNPDAVPQEDFLERLWQGVERYPGYSAYGCRMRRLEDPVWLDGTGDCYHPCGWGWRRDFNRLEAEGHLSPGEIFAPCAAAALYRVEDVQAIGGFDEKFFCYFEDVDLGFRLRLMGKRCFYLPDAIVCHQGSASLGYRSDFAVYYGLRNLIWCWWKNMPAGLVWRYLLAHLLFCLGYCLIAASRGQGGVALRALGAAWVKLPWVLAHRSLRSPQETATLAMTRSWGELYAAFRARRDV